MQRLLLTGTAIALVAASHAASAQETSTQQAGARSAAGAGEGRSGLDEIAVTAPRREELAQRTGIPNDVLTGDDILSQGITQPADLDKIVPWLNVQSAGGASVSFFLRGVGNSTVNGYSDPALAFNYNGVYVGRPTSTAGPFYDLERVDVLKGPQPTLNGHNARAGAINQSSQNIEQSTLRVIEEERIGDTRTTIAQLVFSPREEQWQIAAFVRKLGDHRVVANTPIYNAASSLQYLSTAPRTYGIPASVNV
jgi:outer membrane cobalamin receptor